MQIDQTEYINQIAKRFGYGDGAKKETFPMSEEQSYMFTKMSYIEKAASEPACNATEYRGIIGALLLVKAATETHGRNARTQRSQRTHATQADH